MFPHIGGQIHNSFSPAIIINAEGRTMDKEPDTCNQKKNNDTHISPESGTILQRGISLLVKTKKKEN